LGAHHEHSQNGDRRARTHCVGASIVSPANAPTWNTVQFDARWKTIMESAAIEVFELMAGVRLDLYAAPDQPPRGEQTAMVGMAGALCGVTTVRCSRATSAKFAALTLGTAATPTTCRDALG
jgi:hypothetical protein